MAVENSAYEKGKTKKTATIPKEPPKPETINADFSSDYQAGQGLADRKLQVFNQGYRDRMNQIQDFLHTEFLTTTDTFQIEATHMRSLPSSEARASVNSSLMGVLFGTREITQDEG